MQEPKITLELALQHGLLKEEYEKICEILGRTPTYTELGIYSVMWSEHCSYKNSLVLLRTLPKEGPSILAKAGEENAGLIDIGGGLAVAFKIESHNHPSAVEPYQGAATGVGGIMRDIFTMGARPIAALNSLRFGTLENSRNRYLFDGVIRGIGDYGNCLGIPTVAGEIYFDEAYSENPLVNAMSVGIVKTDRIARAIATGVGNPVFIFGSRTGRDGIHGATFASEEISEESEGKRPQVQVGDPFTEKLIMEATLEMIQKDCIVGIQDMGAAGITCSAAETADKGGCGIELELDKTPLRENGMTPYEILLSESQERMLAIGKKGREQEVINICEKWDLNWAIFGRVTEGNKLKVNWEGETVAEIPVESLAAGSGAPVYEREARRPEYLDSINHFDFEQLEQPKDLNVVLQKLLANPNIASKSWVYEQYDTMVRTNSVILPGSDAAVIRIKSTNKALAMTTDCNGRYVYLNPRRGAQIAVAEAARNVVCTGAKPLAVTNCLNFGNPYKPESFWQFKEAVLGMGEACRVFETPVTGGNVSFYNESPDGAIYPTPVIGMIGLLEDIDHVTPSSFQEEGDAIYILGKTFGEIGGSEYLSTFFDLVKGDVPNLDLNFEKRLQQFLLEVIQSGMIQSAHDTSEGGLAVALAECCIINRTNPLGASIQLEMDGRPDFILFGEDQSRLVVTCNQNNREKLESLALRREIPLQFLGETGGDKFRINDLIEVYIHEIMEIYYNAIPAIMSL
ncbi:phosphoribosylformylglycinamidine synthase subunit PurL [candidate division KSB1 bacterium]|nr:phosphoribosylformylglycinamidine synthase subunit PurL [candidate division KSB1 bacterium]